jgi:hypothetical protein
MRFEEYPISELKSICENYTNRTQIKGYKTMKKNDLVTELSNRFEMVNGKLYSKDVSSVLKKGHQNIAKKSNKSIVKVLDKIADTLVNLVEDLKDEA